MSPEIPNTRVVTGGRMGDLFQCTECPYNTLSVEYAAGHALSHPVPAPAVNAPEEAENTSPAQELVEEAPPGRRRVKKER